MKYKKKATWVKLFLTLLLIGCAATLGAADNISSTHGITAAASIKTNSKTVASPALQSSSSKQLKSVLAKYTKNQILFFQNFQIGDHQNAAFATVNGGEVWYITDTYAQRLKSGLSLTEDAQSDSTFLCTFDNVTIFKCEDILGNSSTSYAWYVKDGKPVELTNTGMCLSYIGNGQFTTIGDAFDLTIVDGIAAGHTYKPYYLYWAGDKLKEYGGLKITKKQLLKVKGAKAIIDVIIKSGHTIDDIYYRANHIININYHSGAKSNRIFDNITLNYNNKTVVPVLVYTDSNDSKVVIFNKNNLSNFSYGGIYQAAFFPDIATYVDKFE